MGELMDYMPRKFNKLKANRSAYSIFDNCWFVSVFTMTIQKSFGLLYFRSGKSLFSSYRVFSLPLTSRYFHRMCTNYLLINGGQQFTGFTGSFTIREHVSTNLDYKLYLPSPTVNNNIGGSSGMCKLT